MGGSLFLNRGMPLTILSLGKEADIHLEDMTGIQMKTAVNLPKISIYFIYTFSSVLRVIFNILMFLLISVTSFWFYRYELEFKFQFFRIHILVTYFSNYVMNL